MSPEFVLVCVVLGVSTAVGVYMAGRHNNHQQQQGKAENYETDLDEVVDVNHPSEAYHKDVKPLQEEHQADLVERLRAAAKALAATHPDGITSDEVHAVVNIPEATDRRVMGAVFNKKDWVHVGWRASTRKINHGRPIRVWKPKP